MAPVAREWLTSLNRGYGLTDLREPLPRMLERLAPAATPSWKQLFVAAGSWTAIFSQGSDLTTSDCLGKVLGRRNLRTHYEPRLIQDGRVVSHGDCALWLRDGAQPVRNIQATFQSRWQWHLDGEPQPFEDLDAYTARHIPGRFTGSSGFRV